jgi:hypothetical protein
MKTPAEAVETTTFRLACGVTMEQFIEANADVDAWLRRQPGFIWRRICRREDGRVVDVLLWASVHDGESAAAGVVTEMAASPVHAAIDQSTVDWSVAACHHSIAAGTDLATT